MCAGRPKFASLKRKATWPLFNPNLYSTTFAPQSSQTPTGAPRSRLSWVIGFTEGLFFDDRDPERLLHEGVEPFEGTEDLKRQASDLVAGAAPDRAVLRDGA